MPIWSNPTPSNATPAALSSNYRVDAPNIGPIVAAILQDRYRQQQQYQDTLTNVGKAIGDYKGQQDTGALADAIAGSSAQNFNADDNATLASLPPEQRLKFVQWKIQQNAADDKLAQQYIPGDMPETSIDPTTKLPFVRGAHGWTAVTAGGETANARGVQNRFEQEQAQKALDQQIDNLNTYGGLKAKDKAGEVSPRITALTLGSPSDVHKGTGPGGEYIPEGYYGIGGQQLDTVVPAKQFDEAHQALDAYNQLLNKPSAAGDQSGQGQQPTGPPVGTKGIVKGVPAVWDGYGWVAQ
jgi:hypothetical protein